MKDLTHKIQTQKDSNERLFILTRTHSMQIFGEIPFVMPQKATPRSLAVILFQNFDLTHNTEAEATPNKAHIVAQ